MARDDPPLIVHVFLSSPGDVPEERKAALDLLKAELPYDPLLRGKAMFDVTSWDDAAAPAPMLPTHTPQQSVNRFMRRPGECQIVVVVLAGRLGTPLDPAAHTRPDGTPYPSGTVWEFEDALSATPRPDVLLYRRSDAPADTRVEAFFARFRNPDGSLRGLWTDYPTPDAFAKRLANDVKHLLRERLDAAADATVRSIPPPPAIPAAPAATPLLPPDRCIGRDAEIAGLVATLIAPRPGAVVALGGPGMGKTTLTRAVATHPDLAARFAERRWFVPLETATDAATLRTAVVLALDGNPADPAAFDHALAALATAPALLVLDNLETPYDADTAATRDTLRRLIGVPSITLLCSYRGHTAPAAPAFSHQPVLPPLPPDAARRLFLELAPRIRPDDPHLVPFLRELGGVPLAIELVALRAAPHDTLAELWGDWQRRGVELATDPDLPEGRLTSLVRSIDLSWRSTRLHDEGRRLFRLLGVLPAGMAREDRAALLGDDTTEAARQLLAIGLAVSSDGRLDLLPPVRDYARHRGTPERAEQALWVEHFLGLGERLGELVGRPGGDQAAARLMPEIANVEAALLAAALGPYRSGAVRAAFRFAEFCRFNGRGGSVLRQLAAICSEADDPQGEAECLECQADIDRTHFEYALANDTYTHALGIYKLIGAHDRQAWCVLCIGDIALARCRYEAAQMSYDEAHSLYRGVNDYLGEANCMLRLSDLSLERSEYEAALAGYTEAWDRYTKLGAVLGEANCMRGIAAIQFDRGALDMAEAGYARAIPLFHEVGDILGEANCIHDLAGIALTRSYCDTARNGYDRALALFRQIGAVLGEANALTGLADVACYMQDALMARDLYHKALALEESVGNTKNEEITRLRLSSLEESPSPSFRRSRKWSASTCHCACGTPA